MKYPLLATLRAQRHQRESVIAESYRVTAAKAVMDANLERKARQQLQDVINKTVGKHIMEQIAANIAYEAQKIVYKDVGEHPSNGIVRIPVRDLAIIDPESAQRRALEYYRMAIAKNIDFSVGDRVSDTQMKVLRITIPALEYNIVEDILLT